MSVLIKGMTIPTSCSDCKAFVCYRQYAGDSGDCFCGITKSDTKVGVQNADCPLVELPPHGRLIDADALNALIDSGDDIDFSEVPETKYAIMQMVNEQDTILEASP